MSNKNFFDFSSVRVIGVIGKFAIICFWSGKTDDEVIVGLDLDWWEPTRKCS